MKKYKQYLFFVVGCLLVVAAIWPILELVNRIYPFILGFPFFIFYMVGLNVLVSVFLFIAFRALD